jgi:hypothetical protein
MGEHSIPQAKYKTSERSGGKFQSGGQMKQHKLMETEVEKGEGADKKGKDKEIVEVNSQEEEGERLSGLDFGGDTDDSDDFQSQVLKIQGQFQEGVLLRLAHGYKDAPTLTSWEFREKNC